MEVPYGSIVDGKLYRNAFSEFPTFELGDIQEGNEQKLIEEMTANFEKLRDKFEGIATKIDGSVNKGSFLSSLLDLKSSIAESKGLGDYESLWYKIGQYESLLGDLVAKNRQKNTDIKQALLLEMEAAVANLDMHEAGEQVKDIKTRWIKTGSPDPDLKEEIEGRFQDLLDGFYEKRNAFHEAKNELSEARISEYKEIIAKIASFVSAGAFTKNLAKVKELQVAWKEKGRIPEADFKTLNEQYWAICNEFYDGLKSQRKADKANQSKNAEDSLSERNRILAAMEELAAKVAEDTRQPLSALKKSWKVAGSLPKSKFGPLQDRFNQLSDELREQSFLRELTSKRNKGFEKLSPDEQIKLLIKSLRNLLRRDEDELSSFSENLGNMHINKGSFVTMLESKLDAQKEKVALKRKMLKSLKEQLDSNKS